jgi:hypothetical protein
LEKISSETGDYFKQCYEAFEATGKKIRQLTWGIDDASENFDDEASSEDVRDEMEAQAHWQCACCGTKLATQRESAIDRHLATVKCQTIAKAVEAAKKTGNV